MTFSGVPNNLSSATILNNGFMPELSVSDFQTRYQVPSEALEPLVLEQLVMAVVEINDQLSLWQSEKMAKGYLALIEIEADTVGEKSVLVWLYERAVFGLAKAWMISPSASIGRRDIADQAVTDSQRYYDSLLVSSEQAMRKIQGRGHISAELL